VAVAVAVAGPVHGDELTTAAMAKAAAAVKRSLTTPEEEVAAEGVVAEGVVAVRCPGRRRRCDT
jgi:hypothetical protein